MKWIIAGDRNMVPKEHHVNFLDLQRDLFKFDEVVSGKARGADIFGEIWANEHGIPVKEFPADWDKFGRAAGPIRNGQMAEYGDALIAFLAPGSKGTKNMIEQAQKKGLFVLVYNLEEDENYETH